MSTVCTQRGCNATALARVYWPGRGWVVYCVPHALRAAEILDAMGYPSPPEALPDYNMLRLLGGGRDRLL